MEAKKSKQRSINILVGDHWLETDKDLFFGPLEDRDEFFVFPSGVMWAAVMGDTKLFSSRSQARKAGWNRPVEDGFQDFRHGGLKHHVAVLNIAEEM
jgi:hypothetical protein